MKNAQAIINLSALSYNSKLAQSNGNNIFAVVKNDAYHFGLEKVVKTFYRAGIRHFATTSLADAKKLRTWYDDIYILSLNQTTDFKTLRDYRIACTLSGFDFIQSYDKFMHDIEWHLEWAGQMNRSGCTSHKEVLETLKHALEHELTISGMWTHFAWADTTRSQYDVEKQQWIDALQLVLQFIPLPYIHAQNSASFVKENGLLPQHTHARLGIYLYGCLPYEKAPIHLAHAIDVKGTVVNIVTLETGESLGYENSFTATQQTRVAIVNIGYGDGLLRKRLLNHDVLINDRRYTCVSVMMSHIAVIVDTTVDIGHSVIIYNQHIPVHEFTFKQCGANSEQLSALNFNSLHLNYII